MREMKESGIQWIPELPDNWDVLRGKAILQLLKRSPEPFTEVITCFRDGEVTLRKNRREEGFTFSDKEIGYQGICCGDLVIHGMDGFAGAIGVSDSNGKGSPVLVVCDSNENKKYLMYYLRMLASQNVFVAMATGVRERSCDLRWDKIANLLFPIPPIEEQNRIVAYLDERCNKIDEIIVQQQAIIDKLHLYKTRKIREIVSRGIREHKEFKDSKNSFIGNIPITWGISKLKYVSNMKTGIPHEKNWLSEDNLEDDFVIVNSRFISTEGKTRKYVSKQIMPLTIGDICTVLSDLPNGRALAKCFIIDKNNLYTLNQRIAAFYNYKLNAKYFYYYMDRNPVLLDYDDGINQTNLKNDSVRNCSVLIPPLDEQTEIVNYLDFECERLKKIIEQKNKMINKLVEYKKSLIYEAVTGKKEV